MKRIGVVLAIVVTLLSFGFQFFSSYNRPTEQLKSSGGGISGREEECPVAIVIQLEDISI